MYQGAGNPHLLRYKRPFEALFLSETTTRRSVPNILMTKPVYEGLKCAQPTAKSITEKWYKPVKVKVPGYSDVVYGGDVIYLDFKAE